MINKKIILILILIGLVSASNVFAEDNSTVNANIVGIDELSCDFNFTADVANEEDISSLNDYSSSFSALNDLFNSTDQENIYLNQSFTYNDEFDSNLSSGIVIDRPLNIFGNGVTLDGSNAARIFNITAENVFIRNITFVNANSDVGGAITGTNYGVIDCRFENNCATSYGGAISGGNALNCMFSNNYARSGGAVYQGSAINCTLISNSARFAGALLNSYAENSTFISNRAKGSSGAMQGNSALNCTFIGNTASDLYGAGNFYAVSSTFINNSATNIAGALSGDALNCTFIGNAAYEAGATFDSFVINCTFKDNHAYMGGAMEGSSVINSTFMDNYATDIGGALLNVYAENCVFQANRARIGGAMYDNSAKNCTFISNHAEESSGAIRGYAIDCIFISNSAQRGGALGEGSVKNCVFESNAADLGGAIYESSAMGSNFTDNHAHIGGAIYGGSAVDCRFIHNSADFGGAIANGCSAISSSFIENVAEISEGANYNATVTNCYLEGNLPKYKLISSSFETIYGFGYEMSVKLVDSLNNLIKGAGTKIEIYNENNELVSTLKCLSGYSAFIDLDVGRYVAVVTLIDNDYNADPINVSINIKKSSSIYVVGVTAVYNINNPLIINLHDSDGIVLKNMAVSITINGATKTYKTNSNGQILFSTKTLIPKTYTAKISFAGTAKYTKASATAKVVVKKAKPIIIPYKMYYYATVKVKQYTVVLKNNVYQLMKNTKLSLRVNGVTYYAKTNSKGKAVFKITKLNKKGIFSASIKYAGSNYYNSVSKAIKIKVI